jgi:hypothetical protein
LIHFKTRFSAITIFRINENDSKFASFFCDFLRFFLRFSTQIGLLPPPIAALFLPVTESSDYPGSAPNSAHSANPANSAPSVQAPAFARPRSLG